MEEKFFEELKEEIQPYFEDAGGHGFDHSERVYNMAIKIAKAEDVDIDVIKVAALLHDIARKIESENKEKCHAEEGAKIAEEILEKTDFPKNKIPNVVHCIKVHRYSKGLKAETKEAEILQDADKLDALGAIITARVFSFDGKHNIPIYEPNNPPKNEYIPYGDSSGVNHLYEKVLKIKPETFKTKKAQEIAGGRSDFVKEFVERIKKEWIGEL